ncbi:hypothetical protein B5807_00477 [Epicoccum nigrum]|uniref:Uncharacterized protein n=1 Tax=Epicoccum nigrum TaxID=105696 RepID=A0A1Y2MF69_EPING|nr:hypothetical protein B5807_00477 [Epicoccum nigrum]
MGEQSANKLTFDNIKAAFAGEDGNVIHLPQEWAGTATIEVYMLSNLAHASDLPRYFNQVGNFTGSELYGAIYQALLAMCADADKDKDKEPKCDNSSPKHKFPSKWPKPGEGMAVYPNENSLIVEANYTTNQEFRLVLGAVAGAFEAALTLPWNCFLVKDKSKNNHYCNAPLEIAAYTERSFLRVFMSNTKYPRSGRGLFHCCETRALVDAKLDPLLPELKKLYPTPRGQERNVMCHLGCGDGDRDGNVNIDEILKQAISNEV